MRRSKMGRTQHEIDARPGETYCVGRVNGGLQGALYPRGTTADNCRVAVERGTVLTITGIPAPIRNSLGLQMVEVVHYIGRNRRKQDRGLVEFGDGRRLSLALFAAEGVGACVGLASFLTSASFS